MSERDLLVGVGARDALDARIIQCAEFDFIWSSSLGVSASYAVPDASLISMSQYLEAARSMNEVVDIPIVVDADTGYGNANNVIYAVKLFEEAGIAGMSIEDKKFPKDNSLLAGGRQELAAVDEFAGKIRAAKDTQKSPDFLVIARVEALIAGWGMGEALSRAARYVEAGADCILIHSKSQSSDEIVEFVKAWDCKTPLVLVPTTYPDLTEEKILSLGKVRMVIYANQVFRAAVKAEEEILMEIKKARGTHTVADRMAPVKHLFELQGVPKMKEQEKKYL
ncbi:MAG: phosphoenolpyruvate phosphomutase [Acidobacteria bacterium]|nr:MAG: phosphoenolpyruvate phosphomutase [Acidobacteriota bacterium]